MNRFSHFIPLLLLIGICGLTACKDEPKGPPSIGEAFAGPIALNLREEVSPNSKIVATLKHGDQLEILQTRRRFVKVRTATGKEGWTDTRQLMTPEQIKELRDFSKSAAKFPSQGLATTFGTLNMHSEPSRTAPSFYQIAEGSSVAVVGHRLAPRVAPASAAAPPPPKPAAPSKRKKAGKEKKEAALQPPPTGPPPKLPPNWLALSKTNAAPAEELEPKPAAAPPKPEPPPAPVHLEDWSLVRTKDGKAGWVLSRMLTMSIPDEVAQYAEGHRITSYFPLATVDDEGVEKKHWLWTTTSANGQPYDFDSFRVFIWALRRHRYETAYIMRNVKGYYPVEVSTGSSPSFSLIMENDDGKRYLYKFAFEVNRARLVEKTLWEPVTEAPKATPVEAPPAAGNPEVSTTDRVKNWFKTANPVK
ncbi:MAG: SH3 domain-containing protein [Bryobacteraceae bacterium]